MSLTARRTFFQGFFKNWSRKSIYPPSSDLITTNNRLYPYYFSSHNDLQDIINIKQSLLLHFTVQADPQYNKSTELLFDILANKDKYPLDSYKYPVHLANISCDSFESKDLMLTYGVNKLPTLVRLHKQIPVDIYSPGKEFNEDELLDWLKKIEE